MDKALHNDAIVLAPVAHRAWIGYARKMDRELHKSGINLSQYGYMIALGEKGKMTMGAISRELGLTMGAGTNLTDKLIRGGFVARERSEEDRRVVFVTITDKGREALKEAHGIVADYLASRLEGLSAAERKAFIAACAKLSSETPPEPSKAPSAK